MFRYGRNYCLVSLDASFLSSRGGGQKTGWEEIKLVAVPRFSASGYYHAFSGNGGRFTLEWTCLLYTSSQCRVLIESSGPVTYKLYKREQVR